MPTPINLAKVSISLQQFQKISSGKYNAGDVKLTGENTVGKVNNHVHAAKCAAAVIDEARALCSEKTGVPLDVLRTNAFGTLQLGTARSKLLAAAIRACGGDADLRKLVFADLDSLFVRSDSTLCKPWGVAQRIDEIKANLAGRRQNHNTNPNPAA